MPATRGFLLVPLAGFAPAAALPLLVAANIGAGVGNTLYNVNATSLRTALTPDDLLGRSQAAVRLLGRGGLPLGALVAVAGMIGGEIYVLCSPVRAVRALPPAPPAWHDR